METKIVFHFKAKVDDREYNFSMPATTEAEARLKLMEDLKNLSDQLEPLGT